MIVRRKKIPPNLDLSRGRCPGLIEFSGPSAVVWAAGRCESLTRAAGWPPVPRARWWSFCWLQGRFGADQAALGRASTASASAIAGADRGNRNQSVRGVAGQA